MQPDAEAAQLFSRFKVDDLPRISDPEQKLYAVAAVGFRPGRPAGRRVSDARHLSDS
jgi:hypothetical protein